MALRCKKMGNMISDAICGRKLHPIAMTPGGWTALPAPKQMRKVKEYVDAREDDIKMMVDLIVSVVPNFPDYLVGFERETEFISLTHPDEFALYRSGRPPPMRRP